MKLERYLKESTEIEEFLRKSGFDVDSSFSSLWGQVEKDCKPFLTDLKKFHNHISFLYRGMNVMGSGVRPTRQDRLPKHTKPIVAELFDKILYKTFGWKPRSEGLFCSGNLDDVSYYGAEKIIFPIGNYKMLWSQKVNDSFEFMGRNFTNDFLRSIIKDDDYLEGLFEKEYGPNGTKNKHGKWYIMNIFTMLEGDSDKLNVYLKDAKDKKEVVKYINKKYPDNDYDIKVDDVYWKYDVDFFRWRDRFYDSVMTNPEYQPLLYSYVEELLDTEFQYRDTDLKEAILSDNEVIIKCDRYYYFEKDWMNIIRVLLTRG